MDSPGEVSMHLTANFQRENAWLRTDYAYIPIFSTLPPPPTSSLETYLYEVGSVNARGLSRGVNSRIIGLFLGVLEDLGSICCLGACRDAYIFQS